MDNDYTDGRQSLNGPTAGKIDTSEADRVSLLARADMPDPRTIASAQSARRYAAASFCAVVVAITWCLLRQPFEGPKHRMIGAHLALQPILLAFVSLHRSDYSLGRAWLALLIAILTLFGGCILLSLTH